MALALFVSLLLVLTSGIAHAADDIILRSSVKPAEAWIGQRVIFNVEVLGADGWAQIPKLPEPELPGAYVMRTESQGVRLSETIGGTSYTGQRYQLSVYCQRPGRLEIPGLPVTVTVKQWGATPPETHHEAVTPTTALICKVPPGAEGIRGLISTTRLEADQNWSVKPETVAPGDALTRTVRLSAEDVSGMAFPPTQHPEIDGVGLYPGQPSVADETNRGSLRGRREESVTYVFDEPGTVVLPDIVLTWWDIGVGRLKRIELPGMKIEIIGVTPAEEPAVEVPQEPSDQPRDLARTVILIVPIAAFGLWLGVWMYRRTRLWWEARKNSEPAHFRRVRSTLAGGDPGAASAAIMRWLDRLDPGARPARLDLLLQDHGDEATRDAAVSLARCIATGERFSDRGKLAGGLKKARRRVLRTRRTARKTRGVLPELNGSGSG